MPPETTETMPSETTETMPPETTETMPLETTETMPRETMAAPLETMPAPLETTSAPPETTPAPPETTPPADAESKPVAQEKGGRKRAPKKKAGAVFKDFNFKLLVIEALMYQRKVLKPKFDVHAFARHHVDRAIDLEKEGHAAIPEAKQYFQDLTLTKTQLGKVTRLAIDGGAQVYLQIIPRRNGEDDTFDIRSVDDAALLPKLKIFDFGDRAELRKKLGPALKGRGIKVLPAK